MADKIRILVATDNHVGYGERDPVRGDDSWKTFHEIMCLAKKRDVDMVLLGGDLFHENKPSRKSMYNVMRSLRLNCLGDKPCELESLGDTTKHFGADTDDVNYENPDINIAIPVFSIHGNHDDPSGEGLYAALDILQMAGLVNYFGRVPQSDNITIEPLLFQKGNTKLALYGLSNVRDERLYRTFRDGHVRFLRPGVQTSDWFNLMCVHQNHVPRTDTSYLPENQLPDYMDLIIWGHEHDCDTTARKNPETGFHILKPGSSVATSLSEGEAITKHVFMVDITGQDYKVEPIRLKTVRPFKYKDIILSQDKEAVRIAKKNDHRTELTRYLEKMVTDLINQAREEWEEAHGELEPEEGRPKPEFPLPLIRLRVETTPPDGLGRRFDLENPQRFSNRFTDQVANRNDVIQFHMRKKGSGSRAVGNIPLDEDALARYQSGTIDINKLVDDYLSRQALSILPTNYFSDAVHEYIQKDDKHAMEMFVNDSLANQIKHLVTLHEDEDDSDAAEDLTAQIEEFRSKLEELYSKGEMQKAKKIVRYKPRPDEWDSEWDGHWEDQPQALMGPEDEGEDGGNKGSTAPRASTSGRGRGRGRGRGVGGRAAAASTTSTRGRGRDASKSGTTTSRAQKQVIRDDDDSDDDDVIMIDEDDDDDHDSQSLFFPEKPQRNNNTTRSRANAAPSARKPTAKQPAASKSRQSVLNFSQQPQMKNGTKSSAMADDIEDSDDDDTFETLPTTRSRGR